MRKFLFLVAILGISLYAAHYPAAYGQLPPGAAVDRATREVDRDIREEAEEKLKHPKKKSPR